MGPENIPIKQPENQNKDFPDIPKLSKENMGAINAIKQAIIKPKFVICIVFLLPITSSIKPNKKAPKPAVIFSIIPNRKISLNEKSNTSLA